MTRHKIDEVMTRDVVTVTEDTRFREIVEIMNERAINAVPVLTEDGHVAGIVTQADLLRRQEFSGQTEAPPFLTSHHRRQAQVKAVATTARGLMSSPAISVPPQTATPRAARLLADRGFKQLLVVDQDGRLAGIVARSDLLRPYLRTDAELHREIVDEVLVRSLWQDPNQIKVTVDQGAVHLSGQIETKSLIRLAVELTAAIEGVVEVTEDLTYALDDSRPGAYPHA